jgi:hypothetical protein
MYLPSASYDLKLKIKGKGDIIGNLAALVLNKKETTSLKTI